jgi:zinc protease
MKSLYKRYYTPDRTKLVIVGPVDPAKIERMIVEQFNSWQGESRSLGEFDSCKVDTNRKSEAAIFSHPKITETLSANQFLQDRQRHEGIDRSIISSKMTIANSIIANRINKQLRGEDTPILRANLNFSFNLCDQYASIGYGVSGKDGSRDAMIPFIQKHINSALAFGFQKSYQSIG